MTFLLLFTTYQLMATPVDSIGLKKINEQWFILHKLEIKQTFFAVSRKYKIPVVELKEANQGIDIDHIKAGTVLMVPYKGVVPEKQEKAASKILSPSEVIPGTNFHIVQPRQNLYRISLKYGVTVNQLKEWNGLASNEIEIGQKLWITSQGEKKPGSSEMIPKPIKPEIAQKSIEAEKTVAAAVAAAAEKKEPVPLPEKPFIPKEEPAIKAKENAEQGQRQGQEQWQGQKPAVTTASFSKAITESGLAVVYNDNSQIDKYYALHRTAPFGTVIMVRNPKNDALVYVKITGKLPVTGENDNLLIKISQKSAEKLKFEGENGEVELSYIL